MKHLKTVIILLLLVTMISIGQARKKFRGGRNQGVAKVGKAMGNALVNLVKDFRSIPQTLDKGYKRQIERPVLQQYTMYGKIKNGLTNFVFLGGALIIAIVVFIVYEIYKLIVREYYRFTLSHLSPEAQKQLVEKAMMARFHQKPQQKKVVCVGINSTQQQRLRVQYIKSLKK